MKIWKRVIAVMASVVLMVFLLPVSAVSVGAETVDTSAETDQSMDAVALSGTYNYEYAYEVLDLVNEEREAEGLAALEMDEDLLAAAMERAVEINLYCSHTRPTGLDCYTIESKARGENIAAGYSSPASVMNGWMNSSGHKANILTSTYTSIGIGCFTQGGTIYWVQMFGITAADTLTQPDNCSVTVSVSFAPDLFQDCLYLYRTKSSLVYGDSITVAARMKNPEWENAYAKLDADSVIWSSSDSSVAVVDSSGTVTTTGAGDVTITATTSTGRLSASLDFTVNAKSISDCSVSLSDTTYIYDGTAKEPAVTVNDGETVLTNGVDYSVSYTDNTDPGTATVTVTGMGNYTDTITDKFTIAKKSAETDITFESGSISTTLTVGETEKIIVQSESDGEITFSSSDDRIATIDETGVLTALSVGEVTITATWGETDYYEATSNSVTLIVESAEITGCAVSLSEIEYIYDGTEKEPVVTVESSIGILSEGTDYTVEYGDNVNAGTATVTINGTGNYYGTTTETFVINRAEQVISVTVSDSDIFVGDSMTILVAGAEGTVHYSSDNTGVATVDSNGTVTGVGEGTTMVTVTATETDNYNEAVQIVTISVRLKSAVDNNEDAGSEDSSGDTGSEDSSGDTGSEDSSGDTGSEDSSGDTGSEDSSGDTGSEDSSGDTGSEDSSGDTGSEDSSGDTGSEDSSGDTGSEDSSGDTGSEDAGGSDDTEDSSSSADTLLVRRGNWFYVNYTLKGGNADMSFTYGKDTDEILIGDWDGDGIDTICVRRGNRFYFSNTLGGQADFYIDFGRTSDEVVVGDWDGDGCDTICVRRGNHYYINNTLESGNAEIDFTFGRVEDEVLVGDWDGDGYDTLCIRRGNTYYINNMLEGGNAAIDFTFGRTSDSALAGDWDGDGYDTLCIRRGNHYYINNTLEGGNAEIDFTFGRDGDEVYAGTWQ